MRRDKFAALLSRKAPLVVCFLTLVVFAAGAAYSVHLGNVLKFYDEYDYTAIAQNIAAKQIFSIDGIKPTAFRAPGYPFALSGLAFVGGGTVSFRVLNYLALAISLLLLFVTVGDRAGDGAGLIAVVLAACYPVLFYTASTLFPQTLASCLLIITVHLCFRQRVPSARTAALLGLLLGFLILLIPTFVFVLLFICVWTVGEQRWRGAGRAILILATASMIVCPWLVRNCTTFDSFMFVSSNGGLNLLLGNSENTTPNAGCTVDISSYTAAAEEMDEVQTDRYYQKAALNYVTDNPGRAVRLYVLKFLNYFNYRNELATRSEASALRDMIMLFTYGPLLLIALIRLVMTFRMPLTRYERFAFTLYLLNGAFSAIFFTRIRFRLPFDYLLISICAIFMSRLVEEKNVSRSSR